MNDSDDLPEGYGDDASGKQLYLRLDELRYDLMLDCFASEIVNPDHAPILFFTPLDKDADSSLDVFTTLYYALDDGVGTTGSVVVE